MNLGAQPFMFDLDRLVAADRAAQGAAVEGCATPRAPNPSVNPKLSRIDPEYLSAVD